MKEKLVLVPDIETSGPIISTHEIVAIGYTIGDLSGNIKLKKRICFKTEKDFDRATCKTFWSKHEEKLKIFQKDAIDPKLAISKFMKDIDFYDKSYDLIIASDNPVFDVGFINYYLALYLNRKPLNYPLNGTKYRNIYDVKSYARGVLKVNYDKLWVKSSEISDNLDIPITTEYDHYPENDAEYIYRLHINIVNKINEINL